MANPMRITGNSAAATDLTVAARYGAFAATLDIRALPDAVRRRAAWILADSIAAIAAGLRVPEMRALAQRLLPMEGGGPGRLIGLAARGPIKEVAFLHGTAGTWLELNEGHLASKGHPAIHVVPAIWAMAEARAASGWDLLSALVAGYEVGARIGRATKLRQAVHPHGTFGTVGAAVGVARLAGADPARIAAAVNVASSLGLATSRRTLLEGSTVRNAYAGASARAGLLALDLVECSFTGEAEGLASVYGAVYGDAFSPEEALRGLGEEWMLTRGYIKLHPCGRYLHSALDLAEALLARHGAGFDAERIAAVTIGAYHPLSMLCGQVPGSTFGARFSAPFAVASLLVAGGRDFANFDAEAVADPRRRALAQRIRIEEVSAFTAAYPARQLCRMTVTWDDGREETLEASYIRGEAENPHDESDLVAKFHAVCEPLWGAAASREALARLLAIEEVPSLTEFDLPATSS
jgi:2-methylcitrate dehydratase PrpD